MSDTVHKDVALKSSNPEELGNSFGEITYDPQQDTPTSYAGREFFGTVAKRAGMSVAQTQEAISRLSESRGSVGPVSVSDMVSYAEQRWGVPFLVPAPERSTQSKEVTMNRWIHVQAGPARAQALSEGRSWLIAQRSGDLPVPGREIRSGSYILPIEHNALIPGPAIHQSDDRAFLAHGAGELLKIVKRQKNQITSKRGWFGNTEQFPLGEAPIAGQFARERESGQVIPTRIILGGGAILPEGQFFGSPELGGFEASIMKTVSLPEDVGDEWFPDLEEGQTYDIENGYLQVAPDMRRAFGQWDQFELEHIGFGVKYYGKPGSLRKQRSIVLQGVGKREVGKAVTIKQGTKGSLSTNPEFFRAEQEAGLEKSYIAMNVVEPTQLMGLWATAMSEQELAKMLGVDKLPERWQPGFTKTLLLKMPRMFKKCQIDLYHNLDDPRIQSAVEAGVAEVLDEEVMENGARFGTVRHTMVSGVFPLRLQAKLAYEFKTRSASGEWMEMLEQMNPALAQMYREGEWRRKASHVHIAGAMAATEGIAPYYAVSSAEEIDWEAALKWADLHPNDKDAILENLASVQNITDTGIYIDLNELGVDKTYFTGLSPRRMKRMTEEEIASYEPDALVLPAPAKVKKRFGQTDVKGVHWDPVYLAYRDVLLAYAKFEGSRDAEIKQQDLEEFQRTASVYMREMRRITDSPRFKETLMATPVPTVGGDILASNVLAPGETFLSPEKTTEVVYQIWNRPEFLDPAIKQKYETPEAFAEVIWGGEIDGPEYLFERPPSTISAEWGTCVRQISGPEMAKRLGISVEEAARIGNYNSPVASASQGGDEDYDPKLERFASRYIISDGEITLFRTSGMIDAEMDRNMIDTARTHPAGEIQSVVLNIRRQGELDSIKDYVKVYLYGPLMATPLLEVTKSSLEFEDRKAMMGPSYNTFLRRMNAAVLSGEPSQAKTEAAFAIRDTLGGPLYMAGQDAEKYPKAARELVDFMNTFNADTQGWSKRVMERNKKTGKMEEKWRPQYISQGGVGDVIDVGLRYTMDLMNDPDLDFGAREAALLWAPADDEAAVEQMTAAFERGATDPRRWSLNVRQQLLESAGYTPGTTGEGQDPKRPEYGGTFISPREREADPRQPKVKEDVFQALVERSPLLTTIQGLGASKAERDFEFNQENRKKYGQRVSEASLTERFYDDPLVDARIHRQFEVGESLTQMTHIVSHHGDPWTKLKTMTQFNELLNRMAEQSVGSSIKRREQDRLQREIGVKKSA